jgi:hypothetical protein
MLPDVAATEEPRNVAHEVNAKVLANGMFESLLNLFGDREIGEVIHVDPKVEGRVSFNEDAGEYTGIMGTSFKANFGHI